MERIHYSGDSILTGSEIARALLSYAQALAARGRSATIDIPVRHADGSLGTANFLVGPASQLVSEPEASQFDEITDEQLIEQLHHATAVLGEIRGFPLEDSDTSMLAQEEIDDGPKGA